MANTEPDLPTPQLPDPDAAAAEQSEAAAGALDARSAAILAFERQWWAQPGAKEEAIRRQFNLSPTMYYELLSRLIDDPAALAAEPLLIRRLRQQRAARKRHPVVSDPVASGPKARSRPVADPKQHPAGS